MLLYQLVFQKHMKMKPLFIQESIWW